MPVVMNESIRKSVERRVSEHTEKDCVLEDDTSEYVYLPNVRSFGIRIFFHAYTAIGSD